VLPFARPRVIAEIAAANPRSIVVSPVAAFSPTDTIIGRHIFDEALAQGAPKSAPVQHPAATATLVGMKPVAVRATAKSGWVESRPTVAKPITVWPAAEPSKVVEPLQAEASPEVKPEAPAADSKWDAFQKLGLKPKKAKSNPAAKLLVGGYRLLGFGILTLIVVALVGYIATTVFYFFSHTWIMPVAVSASDEKVVALKSQLAAQLNERDKVAADLEYTEAAILAQQTFQLEFAKAIKVDLAGRRAALGRVRELASQAEATRTKIRTDSDAYAADHADRMAKEYDAGLIDRGKMLDGKYQLAQISSSNLSLAERQADFEQRASQLAVETRALDALLADKGTTALSYDVLKIKRDYDTSKLELAKATQTRALLTKSLVRNDEIINNLKSAAYLRVLADKAIVAMVPYDNLKDMKPGTKLYSCKLNMVICHEVGSVVEILPGEVTFKHPHRDAQMRGQLVELRLTEDDAAAKDVLFAGDAPLWL
jgi:hypothetical protein